MSEFVSVERINALKSGIEAKTGETYADLTAGVQALVDGFGQGGGHKTATGTVILDADAEYIKVTGIGFTPVAFALCCTKVIADSACGGMFIRGTGTQWRTGTGNTSVGFVGGNVKFKEYSIKSDDAIPAYGTGAFVDSCIVTETGFGVGVYNSARPYRAGAEFEWWATGE